MNEIRLTGIIHRIFDNYSGDNMESIVMKVPTGKIQFKNKRKSICYRYFSFYVLSSDLKKFPEIQKGKVVNITGEVFSNANKFDDLGCVLGIKIKELEKGRI